jgi:hypothetical protein
MEFNKVLAQLREELEHIDAAILSLERLQAKEARRGRPVKPPTEMRKTRPATRRMSSVPRSAERGQNDS